MLFIDTETTGLQSYDEIVEIAIIDEDGKAVLDTLVKPINHTTWPDAQAIHGISPDMVSQAPTYDELKAKIRELTQGETVIIYNKDYDMQYIGPELSDAAKIECCMLPFAEYLAEWNSYYDGYRWQTLLTAANYVCHNWQESAHRAKSDCLATRSVWIYLTRPSEQQRVIDYKQEQEDIVIAERYIKELEWKMTIDDKKNYEVMTCLTNKFWLGVDTRRNWEQWAGRRCVKSDIEDIFSKLFFGKSVEHVYLEDQAHIVYCTQKSIPDNLVFKSWFAKRDVMVGEWFYRALNKSECVYSGKKTVRPLYDISEYERIKTLYPLRFAVIDTDYGRFKAVTKTQAREQGISLDGLEPVAEKQSGYGDWYKVYVVKPEGKK